MKWILVIKKKFYSGYYSKGSTSFIVKTIYETAKYFSQRVKGLATIIKGVKDASLFGLL